MQLNDVRYGKEAYGDISAKGGKLEEVDKTTTFKGNEKRRDHD